MCELKSFLRSFRYALEGIVFLLKNGRNFRFMIVVALGVIWTGWLVGLTGTEWAVQLLCCGLVLAMEGVNTALEQLCDRVTDQPDPFIKRAKDCAAGAVLLLSVFSGAVWTVITIGGGYWEKMLSLRWAGIFCVILPALRFWVFVPERTTKDN